MNKSEITPETKVAELLNAYPELEETLIGLSPAYKNLLNPVMRRTVARFASLRQAAINGKIDLDTMIEILRKKAGAN